MKISNPYTITPSEVKINNRLNILSGNVSSETVNVGYYDDTKIKERLSILETEVDEIQREDANFNRRLQVLESIDHSQFATKTELGALDTRITILENRPVGITEQQMDEIFD